MTDGADSSAQLSFERDVRPLFREKDRDSMRKTFDLWSRSDVQAHQGAILEKLGNGTMPCDAAHGAVELPGPGHICPPWRSRHLERRRCRCRCRRRHPAVRCTKP